MLQKIRWFTFLLGALIVVIVAFQNNRTVELDILFFSGNYPLTLLLLASSALSFVLGAVLMAWRIRSRGKAKAEAAAKTLAAKESAASKQEVAKVPAHDPLTGETDDRPAKS